MLKRNESYRLVTAGLLTAIGLILPYFTSHAFGVPGTILLPMHIPILLCGLLCGPKYGAICGLIVPVISSALTGMPPAYPMLPIMAVQLFAMGFVSGLLYRKLNINLYAALIGGMITGQAVYGLMFYALLFIGSGELRALSVPAAIMAGLPGLIIQLTLIPAIVYILRKYAAVLFEDAKAPAKKADAVKESALNLIAGGSVSCVVIKDGVIAHTADGRGVSPLINIYGSDSGLLKDAFVVDKIIGKAAAMILVLGGAKRAHGSVMSASGREYLERHGVIAEYGRCVDVISNRGGNGICPIEKSVISIDDPEEGMKVITSTIDKLRKAAGH